MQKISKKPVKSFFVISVSLFYCLAFPARFLQALPYQFPWWPAEAGSHMAFPSIVNSLPQQETGRGQKVKWTYLSSHPRHSAVSSHPLTFLHTPVQNLPFLNKNQLFNGCHLCVRTCVRQHAVALESGHIVDAAALV